MAANGEGEGEGEVEDNSNINTVDVVVAGRESAGQTAAKERSRSPCQRDADADMAWKQKWVRGSVLGGNMFLVDDLLGHASQDILGTPAEKKTQLQQRTTRKRVDNVGLSRVTEHAAKTHSCIPQSVIVIEKEAQLQQESARQTTARARLHSPHQSNSDMEQKQKWVNSSGSGAGAGGNMFLVEDFLGYASHSIPCTPAEEKVQLHQALYESRRTTRKRIDDAGPSRVMEDGTETHSCSPHNVVEKDAELQQALHKLARIITKQLGSFGPSRVVENATETHSRIPDYVIEKEAQLQQGLRESARQTRAIKRSHSPCQRDADMVQKQKWVKSSVSSSGVGGDVFFVDDLLGYASHDNPREEKAQVHQALYESQRTSRKQIDDAAPSRVVKDAAETHSCLPCYVAEKETRLQQGPQESARQTAAKERLRSTCQRYADMLQKQKWVMSTVSGTGVGGNMFLVDGLLGQAPHGIPPTPAEEKAQLHQALYESQRTTGKRVDDAVPLRVMKDAAETLSCSPRCLVEMEAELQQALHKLARTIKEELGIFGPLRAVENAAENVYAMTECLHRVQGNQNLDDPFMMQLSTQVHKGTQNIDDPYTLQLSTLVCKVTQNFDNPYTLQLSTQRGALAPVRPTTSQAPGLP